MEHMKINPKAIEAADRMKEEFGSEGDISIDKGNLPSRIIGFYGGRIGGQMTKKLVEMGEKSLINKE
ncbi:Small, acid-soluble spore protein, alpha/beta type [Geosporobacter subterraneus DSM 17957]|uniref:Small, acid-soluble spore protein, alpha/beta type n=1 Tax=Geosporobacter subterraneus DSM 17957 TaxID=1121919 RepID=A0A1M6EBP6_9FIRM|nr:small, acid-soluble spore protein, alpha/beta type [Geosporobacter subterraneus]SHI82720.1 Small, acid-soluble spore protein, alpha/beta type [Geosporobacter subterraneus DSM 17957]